MPKKVGTITFAIALIVLGVTIILDRLLGTDWLGFVLNLWPLILIAIGGEIVWHQARSEKSASGRSWRLDGKSITFLIIVMLIAGGIHTAKSISSVWGVRSFDDLVQTVTHGGPSQKVALKEQTISAVDIESLYINDEVGEISVVGTDSDEIKLTATAWIRTSDEAQAKKRAEQINLDVIKGKETHITVVDEGHKGMSFGFSNLSPSVDLVLQVPSKLKSQVRSHVGRISLNNLASVDVETNVSSVTVGKITGDVKIKTDTGKIEANDIQGHAMLNTDVGSITVNHVEGDLDANADTGRISFSDAAKAVHVRTSTGAIMGTSVSIGGNYELGTHTGSVQLDLSGTPNASFDARSNTGSIRGSLPWNVNKEGIKKTGTATLGDGKNKVNIQTETGSIEVNTH